MKVLISASKEVSSIKTSKGRSYSFQNVIGLLQDGTEVYGIIGGFTAGINQEVAGKDFTMFKKMAAGEVVEMEEQEKVTGKDGIERRSFRYNYYQALGESPYKEKASADVVSAFLAEGRKALDQAKLAAQTGVVTTPSKFRK